MIDFKDGLDYTVRIMDSFLQIKNIRKNFGSTEVLKGISLDIEEGKFVTLLGASGCGKTTLLRIIAGLESADSGRIILDGTDITDLPPEKRHLSMVFQNYALFEHMTVAANIGYPLRVAKVPKKEIAKKVDEMLELISLPGYGNRMPDELSGGQRQRVAIARSIVYTPKVILLDEPLGALDADLRKKMQTELKNLQHNLGITFVYITHDREEAYSMSDRIALISNGIIDFMGLPDEIKERNNT